MPLTQRCALPSGHEDANALRSPLRSNDLFRCRPSVTSWLMEKRFVLLHELTTGRTVRRRLSGRKLEEQAPSVLAAVARWRERLERDFKSRKRLRNLSTQFPKDDLRSYWIASKGFL